jgi:FixJ family two-component response regulator
VTDSGQQIFVVDDDEGVLKSLKRLLKASGFAVETFTSPLRFLERPSPEGPSCVVLDLSMPDMDGMSVHRAIVERDWPCGVVILTGHGDIPSSVESMKLGAIDFLTKPVDEDDLVRAVQEALARQEQAVELNAHYEDLKSRFEPLTARENEVMERIVNGRLNKQIAHELGISEKTVKAHRAKVMQKTGARSLAGLVQLYFELRQSAETGREPPA